MNKFSFYKTAISFEDAKDIFKSKRFDKLIRNLAIERSKSLNPEKSFSELSKELEPFIKTYKGFIRNVIINRASDLDITDAEKGLTTIWLYKAFNPYLEQLLFSDENAVYGLLDFIDIKIHDLETFFHWKQFMSERDLNRISSLDELVNIVNEAKPKIEEYQNKQTYLDAEEGKSVIYDDENWTVYEVHNKGAACELGKGTEWCTAAPGLNWFEEYYDPESPLIVFINKHDPNEKYQFSYINEQFMDKDDNDISDTKKFNQLEGLISEYLDENYWHLSPIYYVLDTPREELLKHPDRVKWAIKKFAEVSPLDFLSIQNQREIRNLPGYYDAMKIAVVMAAQKSPGFAINQLLAIKQQLGIPSDIYHLGTKESLKEIITRYPLHFFQLGTPDIPGYDELLPEAIAELAKRQPGMFHKHVKPDMPGYDELGKYVAKFYAENAPYNFFEKIMPTMPGYHEYGPNVAKHILEHGQDHTIQKFWPQIQDLLQDEFDASEQAKEFKPLDKLESWLSSNGFRKESLRIKNLNK